MERQRDQWNKIEPRNSPTLTVISFFTNMPKEFNGKESFQKMRLQLYIHMERGEEGRERGGGALYPASLPHQPGAGKK